MQLSRNTKISLAAFVAFDLLLIYWLATLFIARSEVAVVNELNELGAIKYPEPFELTAFELTDQDNNTFTREDFLGPWSLVFFGFTSCPDVCPITMSELAQTYRELQSQPDQALPQVVFVSVDPERDSIEGVREYVQRFDSEFIGLIGSETETANIAAQFFVAFSKVDEDMADMGHEMPSMPDMQAGDYMMNHNIHVSLVNPQGELTAVVRPPIRREVLAKLYPLLTGQ
ncbi:MAG: SCO family protein [Pseudomonadales bacterium]|nr:SCO family protein [Pseudomonadales bacterium]